MMRSARLLGSALMVMVGTAAALWGQNLQSRGLGQAKAAAAASGGQTAAPKAEKPAGVAGAPATASKPAAAPVKGKPASAAGAKPGEKRDPFRPTIQAPKPGEGTAQFDCPSGVRGILIGQAELNGVARSPGGMIAVVTMSNSGRTYFLREGAVLCNGRVMRITADSIAFEENVIDLAGKASKREVIKKIPAEAK